MVMTEPADETVFDLVAGHPALELVNTVSSWLVAEPRDDLSSLRAVLRFGQAVGLLDEEEAEQLLERATAHPEVVIAELGRLRQLRDCLHRLAAAQACGHEPAAADLDLLGRGLAEALPQGRLRRIGDGCYGPVFTVAGTGLGVLRCRLLAAAAELLRGGALERVKECPACGWVFLDQSKNRSRRWCQMKTCGSAAKARRYYRRKKAR
jgi:predicted RNA-binding Zn ribbon-like protein